MKSIYIAGSRKFYDEIEQLVHQIRNVKIKVSTAGKWKNTQKDTLENQKAALLSAFSEIDFSDICYVYAKDGYIGKTVAMEIAYAYAHKKKIISSDVLIELSAQALVFDIVKPSELISYCR
jgi:hypothetical protein